VSAEGYVIEGKLNDITNIKVVASSTDSLFLNTFPPLLRYLLGVAH
jgi:hypothetical protein